MKFSTATIVYIALHFSSLSLLAFGGANTIIPEIHRQAVDVTHWMNETEFADLFAISQAAPGPNTLIVTLVGWQAAGITGALVATLAMCLPAATLTYVVLKIWSHFKEAPWRVIVQRGLTPVTVGMVASSAFLLTRATATTVTELTITLATAALAFGTRWNPIWLLAAAGFVGFIGL